MMKLSTLSPSRTQSASCSPDAKTGDSMLELTPKGRVQAALWGRELDRIPFTAYWLLLPRGETERKLRNQGMAIIERVDPYRIETPNVDVHTRTVYENGSPVRYQHISTPVGDLTSVQKRDPAY